MKKEKLKNVREATDRHMHGHARFLVAKQFKYLARFQKQFKLLNDLQKLDGGGLNKFMYMYRERLTARMIWTIRNVDGKEVADLVVESLY